jgi:hypothetical protein
LLRLPNDMRSPCDYLGSLLLLPGAGEAYEEKII